MLAYYLHTLSPFLIRFGENIGLRWYGLAYVMAFVVGIAVYRYLSRRGYSELGLDQVADFIVWTAIFGVMLGGRVGWILFYGISQDHSMDPWWWPLEIWKGGMASHGGMLGIIFFTLYYSRKHHVSWTGIGDNLCVVAPIGLFFGRLANFINGELYGYAARVSWAVQFPEELRDDGVLAATAEGRLGLPLPAIIEQARTDAGVQNVLRDILTPRHPSQLYEAFLEGVVLFSVLWILRTRFRMPRGMLTGLFFILYALLRIVGETFRVPDAPMSGPLTRGQFLSLFLILIGLAFVIYAWSRRHYEAADRKKAGSTAG